MMLGSHNCEEERNHCATQDVKQTSCFDFYQVGLSVLCITMNIHFFLSVSQFSILLSHNYNKEDEYYSKPLIFTRTRVSPTTVIQIPYKSLPKFTVKV